MRVRMRTLLATPTATAQPGEIVDLPDEMATGLVDGGYAVSVEPPPQVRKVVEEAEIADAAPPAETAAQTRFRGRLRRTPRG